jgi:glucosyl-dolichyl phosphate glucuronosyltransferase
MEQTKSLPADAPIKVSVIIPTYNRSCQLAQAIDSFIDQDIDQDSYEIIVCDNNSSDATRDVVKMFQDKRQSCKISYIFEARQGVHYARNTAAKLALGDVLYFTDDDMLATPSLLRSLLKVFDIDSRIGCVTGSVLPKWEVDPPEWILKHCANYLLSLITRSEELIVADYDVGCYSCHHAIKRNVFFRTGGFHPENTAGEWIGDGETGLNLVIGSLGFLFAYTANSIIYHSIPPSRMTQQYLNKRLYNQGFCDSYSEYRLPGGQSRYVLFSSILGSLARIPRALCLALLKRIAFKDGWHVELGYCTYNLGKVAYKLRLLRSPSWRRLVLRRDWLRDCPNEAEVLK